MQIAAVTLNHVYKAYGCTGEIKSEKRRFTFNLSVKWETGYEINPFSAQSYDPFGQRHGQRKAPLVDDIRRPQCKNLSDSRMM